MEKIEVLAETNPVELIKSISNPTVPVECPTCVSGVDPTIGSTLFQEALHDGV